MAAQVCIGGPADGERVTVLHGRAFKWAGQGDPLNTLRPSSETIYRRETLAAPPGFEVDVWVADHLRPDEALQMLVAGYRVPR
jgi:hypothetical protein